MQLHAAKHLSIFKHFGMVVANTWGQGNRKLYTHRPHNARAGWGQIDYIAASGDPNKSFSFVDTVRWNMLDSCLASDHCPVVAVLFVISCSSVSIRSAYCFAPKKKRCSKPWTRSLVGWLPADTAEEDNFACAISDALGDLAECEGWQGNGCSSDENGCGCTQHSV